MFSSRTVSSSERMLMVRSPQSGGYPMPTEYPRRLGFSSPYEASFQFQALASSRMGTPAAVASRTARRPSATASSKRSIASLGGPRVTVRARGT